ncbi:amino acid permease, partial [candidate division KSB1 bacterium]
MPVQSKKYGAFAGVFTPSILTILGVIMYMRLGWVVGESGLIGAILIIIVAHVISISTGLSISSIATDKRIKTGGIYYILSRSLGLPMGGAIGIAIFIGTALSISLYIVGFCENFLGINEISEFLGMGTSIKDYQIVGTIVIITLVILAFISTSLVIKTQFFILLAIALSLISIFIGFFINPSFHPDSLLIKPTTGFSPEFVFAIFFPAVTGFTAGVAMSGDLKDPKKSIPGGTLAAILVGLIVYISMAIFFALYVDRNLLLNDNNFLMKIAWLSPLVIAGIWGATLSSALGGILGGPRILQAISLDRIMPRIFGAGYGKNNEPRNALILTFIIAEIGILIGELNVIARIVSMFYIAAYGFINLSFALESWASADFRPSFKISRWFGIIGFIASFAVMFKIDTLAMFLALIIMFGIYFILRRKKFHSDFGDVWQSVWSTIIRTSLQKTHDSKLEERNWQPNIMLFSGGKEIRPYLLDIATWITGKHGLLSDFELVEDKAAKKLFPENKQYLIPDKKDGINGIFHIKQTCKNIFEGIETISNIYGFSGIEPNTVILGWARQSKDPTRFIQMLQNLTELNLNILMVNYDREKAFGKRKLIDIWWRGSGNNGNLALNLIKFIERNPNWRNSRIRLLIVNPANDEKDKIYINAKEILENLRINAEIKIINNQIEQKPYYDIIKAESLNTDLTFIGFHDIDQGNEIQFVDDTNKLCSVIGTVIMVKASSKFKKLKIGTKDSIFKPEAEKGEERTSLPLIPDETIIVSLPKKKELESAVSDFQMKFNLILKSFLEIHVNPAISKLESLIRKLNNIQPNSNEEFKINKSHRLVRASKIHNSYLNNFKRIIDDFTSNEILAQTNLIKEGLQ